MQETPKSLKHENKSESPQLFAYFTVLEHPLNEVHPLGMAQIQDRGDDLCQSSSNQMSINLAIRSPIQILYQSDRVPLVVSHCSQTKQLYFGILKAVSKKENVGSRSLR
jgi:hypothetical protein